MLAKGLKTMPHNKNIAKFGAYYGQLKDKFYRAVEWRFNEANHNPQLKAEAEILGLVLDSLIADAVAHDVLLPELEAALKEFKAVSSNAYTPNKYTKMLALLNVHADKATGYVPQLYGAIAFDARQDG
jgi:hypothetical protein